MSCPYCRTPYRPGDNYCGKCGEPRPPDAATEGDEAGEVRREFCDIHLRPAGLSLPFLPPKGRLEGQVTGDNGRYRLDLPHRFRVQYLSTGEIWPVLSDQELRQVLGAVTQTLMREGWIPAGHHGPHPWQLRFWREGDTRR